MPVKKILLGFSFLLLGKVSFAIAFIPKPFAKYNSTKTHYLVSIPDPKNYLGGYTAVFETKNHKFLYKLDVYFSDQLVFLTDDGSQLLYFETKRETKTDFTEETCNLNFYDGASITSLEIYKRKMTETIEGYLIRTISEAHLERNALSVYTDDFVYDVQLNGQKISTRENDLSSDGIGKAFTEDFMNVDSILNIQNIHLANGQSLKEKLLQDLNLKEVPDQSGAQIVIYYDLYISKENSFLRPQFQVFGLQKKSRSGNQKLLTDLNDEINEKIKSYSYTERIIPEGVDYWVYEGKIYVME